MDNLDKQYKEFIENYKTKMSSYGFNYYSEPTYTNSLEEFDRLKKTVQELCDIVMEQQKQLKMLDKYLKAAQKYNELEKDFEE